MAAIETNAVATSETAVAAPAPSTAVSPRAPIVVNHDRGEFEIPSSVNCLTSFREWVQAADLPRFARIGFVDRRITIDMSPEDLFCHNAIKTTIGGELYAWNKSTKRGHVFIDRALVVAPAAGLASEPDVVYTSLESIETGRVRLVPKSNQAAGRYIELEGAPDLVVEVVSDSSVTKDRRTLYAAYFASGIREYWLADGRGEALAFTIFHRGVASFDSAPVDAEGFQPSAVLGKRLRLTRTWNQAGWWDFEIHFQA